MVYEELPDRCCGCVGEQCCNCGEAPCSDSVRKDDPVVHLGQLDHLEIASQDDQTPIGEVTVIRPGDTVLIGTNRRLSQAEANHLATQLGDRMPGVKVLVVEGVTAISAYRPEAPDQPR